MKTERERDGRKKERKGNRKCILKPLMLSDRHKDLKSQTDLEEREREEDGEVKKKTGIVTVD